MDANVTRLFARMLSQPTAQQRYDIPFMLEHPVLLWPDKWEYIRAFIAELPDEEKKEAEKLLMFLQVGYERFTKDAVYPYGRGPMEPVFEQYKTGAVTGAIAETLVRDPAVSGLLSPLYVGKLNGIVNDTVQQQPREWKNMLQLLDIILSAIYALPAEDKSLPGWQDMNEQSLLTYLEVAVYALVEVPDKRVLDKAVARGETIASPAYIQLNGSVAAEALHRLGVLHLDSYFIGKSASNFDVQYRDWQSRLYDYYGDALLGLAPGTIEMPAPADALSLAAGYLEKAIALRSGVAKAVSLKALAEALEWKNVLSGSTESERICRTINEALPLLNNQQEYESQMAALTALSDRHHCAVATDVSLENGYKKILGSKPEALLEEYGHWKFFSETGEFIRYFQGRQPQVALALYRKAQEVLDSYPDEAVAANHFKTGTGLVFALADPFIGDKQKTPSRELFNAYIHSISSSDSNTLTIHCTAMAIAFESSSKAEEGEGLGILSYTAAVIEKENQYGFFVPLCDYMIAALELGEGVNQHEQNNTKGAIEYYFKSLGHFLSLGYPGKIPALLGNLEEISRHCSIAECEIILASLSEMTLQLQKLGSDAINVQCINIYRFLLQQFFVVQPVKLMVLVLLFQLLKGYSYASLLRSPARLSVGKDPDARRLLQEIDRLFHSLDQKFPPSGFRVIDKETWLTAYAGSQERLPGDDAVSRLTNLRISFDTLFYSTMLERVAIKDCLLLPEQLQQLVDPDTVLMAQYTGPSPQGFAAIYILLITREETRCTMGYDETLPSGTAQITENGNTASTPLIAFGVPDTRKAIVGDEPGDTGISPNAAHRLEDHSSYLIGGEIPSWLDVFRKQGKSRLCIWPHGPFHYFPFHLLPLPSGDLLGDQWTVTSIHSPGLLATKEQQAPAPNPVNVMAMTFTENNPYHIPALPDAIQMTNDIAELFAVNVLADGKLTQAGFIEALQTSKWVHLYTHGYLNVGAPSFHSLFLEPTGADDGILYAWEIAGLNLAHIDLLTLCACETALGRFDHLDNLRGLPASFLQAGVSTVIGSLWDAEPESAAFFFKILYEQLKSGASKPAAFKKAQTETRKSYPEYRDWGAFYYLGK